MKTLTGGRRGLFDALMWTALLMLGGISGAAASEDDPEPYVDPDDANVQEDDPNDYAWPGGLEAFADRPVEVFQGIGVVGQMDPAGPYVMISGLMYGFALDAEVRLISGYGAPTLVLQDMALEYYFTEPLRPELAGTIIAAVEIPLEGEAD